MKETPYLPHPIEMFDIYRAKVIGWSSEIFKPVHMYLMDQFVYSFFLFQCVKAVVVALNAIFYIENIEIKPPIHHNSTRIRLK